MVKRSPAFSKSWRIFSRPGSTWGAPVEACTTWTCTLTGEAASTTAAPSESADVRRDYSSPARGLCCAGTGA